VLKPDGKILVLANNDRSDDVGGYNITFAHQAGRFLYPNVTIEDIQFLGRSKWCIGVHRSMVRLASNVRRSPFWYLPLAVFSAPLLMMATYLCNRAALRTKGAPPPRGYCSSVFMTLKIVNPAHVKLPDFELMRTRIAAPGMWRNVGRASAGPASA
jgi:hypothetical protein